MTATTLRLGTRGSLLARTQSGGVARQLEQATPGLRVELVIVKTTGDRITDRPLADEGGKGLFTREIELSLLDRSIDFAVHSLKDVPVTEPLVDQRGLTIAAIPPRLDPRDCLISPNAATLDQVPHAARIGTSSLRRRAQLLTTRPDLRIQLLRGNIDTRLDKLRRGGFDAIILALAGIERVGRFNNALCSILPLETMLPAAGQGALALQCRADDQNTIERLLTLNHPDSALAVKLERQVIARLGGDCHSPIAALVQVEGDALTLRAAVGAHDGNPPVIHARAVAPRSDADGLVVRVCQQLAEQGASALLSRG